jgi:hypothetical protein
MDERWRWNPKRPQKAALGGLFIGACGRAVAAATPEVRFDGRISEQSAERSERRPLTLMNSAPRAAPRRERRARKENAGGWPAFGMWEDEALTCREKSADFRPGRKPRDRAVSMRIRRLDLTIERLLWLSEFNAVIEVRCLINESSNST